MSMPSKTVDTSDIEDQASMTLLDLDSRYQFFSCLTHVRL